MKQFRMRVLFKDVNGKMCSRNQVVTAFNAGEASRFIASFVYAVFGAGCVIIRTWAS